MTQPIASAWCVACLLLSGSLADEPQDALSATGRVPRSAPHEPPTTAAAFAPDATFVVIGSQAGLEWRSWPDLLPRRRLATRLRQIHAIVSSADTRRFAVAGGVPGERGELEIFSWSTGESLELHQLHEDVIHQLAWQAGDRGWITASADSRIVVSDESGRPCVTLQGHSRSVLALTRLGDVTLVSGGRDATIRVWDLTRAWDARSHEARGDDRLRRSLDQHRGDVRDLAARPGDARTPMVASASDDGTVRFWQPTIGRLVRFRKLPSPPLAIAWLPNGSRLLVSSVDGRVRAINPETSEMDGDWAGIDRWAYTLAAAPDGRSALVAGDGGLVRRVQLDR